MVEKYSQLQILDNIREWTSLMGIATLTTNGVGSHRFQPDFFAPPHWATPEMDVLEVSYDPEYQSHFINPLELLKSLSLPHPVLDQVKKFDVRVTTLDNTDTMADLLEALEKEVEDRAGTEHEFTEEEYERILNDIYTQHYSPYPTPHTSWKVKLHLVDNLQDTKKYQKMSQQLSYRNINDHHMRRPLEQAVVSFGFISVDTAIFQKLINPVVLPSEVRVFVKIPYLSKNEKRQEFGWGNIDVEFLPYIDRINITFGNHDWYSTDPFMRGSYAFQISTGTPVSLKPGTGSAMFGDHHFPVGKGVQQTAEHMEPFLQEVLEIASQYASGAMELAAKTVLISKEK